METATEPVLLRWETLTKTKFDQLDRSRCVVLVTCSPLEVHGPHLPFGADALEGQGLMIRTLQFLPERYRAFTFLQLPFILFLEEHGETPPAIERGKPAGLLTMINAFRGALRFFRAETYAGTPGAASAELGERILDTLAAKAAEAVTEILDGTLPREQWHSPLWPKRFVFINPLMVRLFNRVLHITDGIA